MSDSKQKHFSKILCLQRRSGCWGFQENHHLQQSGRSQQTVEAAKDIQILLIFHTHWDLTDKTGDKTEILLSKQQSLYNLWLHISTMRRTFLKALLNVEFSQKPSTLTFPKSDQLWKAKACWNLHKNLMSEKQLASQTKHCNSPKQIYQLCNKMVADYIFKWWCFFLCIEGTLRCCCKNWVVRHKKLQSENGETQVSTSAMFQATND